MYFLKLVTTVSLKIRKLSKIIYVILRLVIVQVFENETQFRKEIIYFEILFIMIIRSYRHGTNTGRI
jgi:hypothetical protein